MNVTTIDHMVVYAGDVETTAAWYERVAGGEVERFAGGRTAVRLGDRKLNLHQSGAEYDPHAATPAVGAADFCLVVEDTVEDVVEHLEAEGETIVEGPVEKTGSRGPMTSVYVRDPDGNLVEFARYHD